MTSNEEFKIALSTEELERRTNKDALPSTTMLKVDAPEFENLADGDKEALKHLVKAGKILEEVHLYLSHNNVFFYQHHYYRPM